METRAEGGLPVGSKARELCKWKREDYEKQLAELRAIVARPQVVCLKCGRAADKKKWVCKPVKLQD